MTNDYFNHTSNRIPAASTARSAQVNTIGDEIALGLDKLPSRDNLTAGTTDYLVDTGIADAYVVTFVAPLVPTAYIEGLKLSIRPTNENTGASTVNVNALGVKSLKRYDGSALAPKTLKVDKVLTFRYDATAGEFRLAHPISTVKNASGVEIVVGS